MFPVVQPASQDAEAIFHLSWVLLAVCAGIFLVVVTLTTIAVVKYRNRPEPESPTKENRWLERLWTGVPVAIIAVLVVLTVPVVWNTDPPTLAEAPVDMTVVGHQWWWEVRYPDGAVAANEVHIPAGRPLTVQLESADVIHSFWVPRLARKVDMVPGHPNRLRLEAREPGSYHGTCAEFCGRQHAHMRLLVVAQSPEDFAAWKAAQAEPAAEPTSDLARRGLRIMEHSGCGSCHRVAGTSMGSDVGPDLTHLASRRTLAAGTLTNDHDGLRRWLSSPDAFKPDSHMPDYHFDDADVEAVATYLEGLR